MDVILGAQWGDEGKGKLVDILASKYDICARVAGGKILLTPTFHRRGHCPLLTFISLLLHLKYFPPTYLFQAPMQVGNATLNAR